VVRHAVVTPASLGGASITVVRARSRLFMPVLYLRIRRSSPPADVVGFLLEWPIRIVQAWIVMFFMGILITAIGVVIAARLKSYEGFGAISNGIIQPLYFLSGSIFPLRGIIGGVGFLEITDAIRAELNRIGIFAIGGGWVVELPWWIKTLVYANPVSYQLDLLRRVLLDFSQLPRALDLLVTFALPPAATVLAAWAMGRMLKQK
jgi:ABC-2 type transport system permease protein